MKIVLLSGGSGRRLWPLSNDVRSKQFLKLFKGPGGEYESMLQRVFRQIKEVFPDSTVIIATSENQQSAIKNQLGNDVDICVEPCRRDTFPAIALSTLFLKDVLHTDAEEPVIVCPVDPYVENTFFSKFKDIENEIIKNECSLSLMGISPVFPSEKYGYILLDKENKAIGFKEKPSQNKAEEYIKSGALWNSGVFGFKLSYILEKTFELTGIKTYKELYNSYNSLEKISFDYAVSEHEKSMSVVQYSGEWRDVGTWNTITEVISENNVGDARQDECCNNVHILNELDVPILCMGLNNVVVSASPQGILVADKERSSFMKSFVDDIKQDTMFEEKSWGFYKVIDVTKGSLTIKVTLNSNQKMKYHLHHYRDEVWTVVSGKGFVVIDGKKQYIKSGITINIPRETKHTVFSETKLEMIEVQIGSDIRLEDKEIFDLDIENKYIGG